MTKKDKLTKLEQSARDTVVGLFRIIEEMESIEEAAGLSTSRAMFEYLKEKHYDLFNKLIAPKEYEKQ